MKNEYFENIVRVNNIKKSLNGKLILSNVSLSATPGEIVGITGPIGAGKSTLLYVLAGLLEPDEGSVRVFSRSFNLSRTYILHNLNYASANHRLSGYATTQENLFTYALLYGKTLDRNSVVRFLRHFGADPQTLLSKKVYRLSSGENSLINLCKAFINSPQLLLLDEITTHFDPITAQKTHSYLKAYASQGNTIILVSQNLKEIQTLCSRVIVLVRGQVRYAGPPKAARDITTYYA